MNDIIIKYVKDELLEGNEGMELEADQDLLGSGLIDSLGMMNLVAFVEEQFEVSIPPGDLTIENFMTIDAISTYLESRKQQA